MERCIPPTLAEFREQGLANPARLLLAIVDWHNRHGGGLEADRESFERCADQCEPHEDLEHGFVLSDLMSDIRTLACMGNFRVIATSGVLTLERLPDA